MPDALVFPLGHYLGPFYASAGQPAQHHVVRVGWDTPKLPDEEHVDIWSLTHGLPARIGERAWTRQAVVDAATDAGMPAAQEILSNLAELGVIAEVEPGTPGAVEFAQHFRVQSLLVGLGNTPEPGSLDSIGLIGLPPVVQVQPEVFEFWQLAQLWPNLWDACNSFAQVARDQGLTDARRTDPTAVLDFFLVAIRILIARNAIFLDVARG